MPMTGLCAFDEFELLRAAQVPLRAAHALLRLKQRLLSSKDGNGIWPRNIRA